MTINQKLSKSKRVNLLKSTTVHTLRMASTRFLNALSVRS
jgi:hypothetical protein